MKHTIISPHWDIRISLEWQTQPCTRGFVWTIIGSESGAIAKAGYVPISEAVTAGPIE